ncbi:MAG: Hsp20/alpha crystallin family protein [Bacteroidales bacterium]
MEGKIMTLARLSNNWTPTFPSMLDKFLEGDLMDWGNSNFAGSNSTLPAVNIKEDENEYMIEVAAPGMKKDDFKVHFDNGRLMISSEKKNEVEQKNGESITRREFSYKSFQRSFNVSEHVVDSDKIKASYVDGILNIRLPKKEEVKPKPAKEIKIS